MNRSYLFAMIAVLLLVALPARALAATVPDRDPPPFALYATDDQGQTWQPLDPLTLEDMTAAETLTFDSRSQMAVSADGSTVATINPKQGPLEDWITVRDGINGPVRLTIDVEEAVFNPRLSADGTRLIVAPTQMCSPFGCSERVWYSYDTRSGNLIATTRVDLGTPVWPELIDPTGRWLYYPFYQGPPPETYPPTPTPANISETGPWPLRIAVFDLTTGEEAGRMTVPDVSAGTWQDDSGTQQMYVSETVDPAIALSPDGKRLAVVDGAMHTLTLLDADTREVVATHAIHEPESLGHQILGWLGIAPRSAQAKAMDGRSQAMTFSADGQHLLLTGTELEVDETSGEISGQGLGLVRIDAASGEISGEALPGAVITRVLPSPDGRAVYAPGPAVPWGENDTGDADYTLSRLDDDTLTPVTARDFTAWPNLSLVATTPDAG